VTMVTRDGSSPWKGSTTKFPRDFGEAGGSPVVELGQRVIGERASLRARAER
jgi:hypothetical protein